MDESIKIKEIKYTYKSKISVKVKIKPQLQIHYSQSHKLLYQYNKIPIGECNILSRIQLEWLQNLMQISVCFINKVTDYCISTMQKIL